jgi:DNA-binding transcriptional MerR regulator
MALTKASGALLSIGEVAAQTGIAQHVLRYWEARLPQLNPLKRSGGRRFYRPEDVALVRDIQRLIDQDGFTLDGAAKALRRGGSGPVATAAPPVTGHGSAPADIRPQLRAIRDRLARALA